MRRLLCAPVMDTPARAPRARVVAFVARATVVVCTAALAAITVASPEVWRRTAAAVLAVWLVCAAAQLLARRARPRAASWVLILGLVALVTAMAVTARGIRSPGISSYFVFVLMAGLLLGEVAAMVVALLCWTLGLGLVLAELHGLLPAGADYHPVARWLLVGLYIGIVIALLRLATHTIGSALRRAEGELAERRKAERRLALALEAGAIGVWEHDVVRDELVLDERALAILGLDFPPGGRIPFETMRRMIHPDDAPAVRGVLDALLRGTGRERIDYRVTRPDGEVRHVAVAASAVPADAAQRRPASLVGVVLDVSEARRAEAQRERLVADLGERVKELRLLHAAARLLQRDRPYTPEVLAELVVMVPAAWQHPEICAARIRYGSAEAVSPGWCETPWRQAAAFATREAEGVVEVVYVREPPPGLEGPSADPFLEQEHDLIASLAEMLEAYLERHAAERQRASLEQQLRQSQKMEALGTLAGGIAHDFNNILAAIGSNLELALQDAPEGHEVRTSLDEIRTAHARARELVQRILLFSRGRPPERVPLAPAAVVGEALGLLRASLPPTVELRTSWAPGLPPVLADATQLHQIVLNLATNALHAMGPAGGRLSVALEPVAVTAEDAAAAAEPGPGSYVRLTVRDTGTGIPPEIRDRLFEPFFTTKGVESTGLGLAVVHGIVRDHGGAITVSSEVGRGSAFCVYLPAAPGAEAGEAPAAPALVRGGGERVMYVDDEEALVFVMTRLLRRLGYEPLAFSDPAAALHAFRLSPGDVDAVIADLAMPGMSGAELLRALREIRPGLPVALASGHVPEDGAALAALGDLPVRIRKPATLEEIARTLEELLGNGSARPSP